MRYEWRKDSWKVKDPKGWSASSPLQIGVWMLRESLSYRFELNQTNLTTSRRKLTKERTNQMKQPTKATHKKTIPKTSLPKGYKKAIKDKLAEKGISRDWMSKHLEII